MNSVQFLPWNALTILVLCFHLIRSLLVHSFKQDRSICWWDHFKSEQKCRLACDKGFFSLTGMSDCHPWLTCKDLSDINSGPSLGTGAVKMVIIGSWQGHPVTINKLRQGKYTDDFLHGLDMVKLLQPNPRVIQLVGFCLQKEIYFTEYHHLGSADRLEVVMNSMELNLNQMGRDNNFDTLQHLDVSEPHTFFTKISENTINKENENIMCTGINRLSSSIPVCSVSESPDMQWMGLSNLCPLNINSKIYCRLKTENLYNLPALNEKKTDVDKQIIQNVDKKFKILSIRFQLCLDYIAILSILHNSPTGTRIMCDSNDLLKTLSQFLLTDNMRLLVNDLDALPLVNSAAGITAKCGHIEITGDFVAPEQLWPFDDKEFSENEMPGYDEKTDIWKIPQICDAFIGNVGGGTTLKLHLFNINAKCKDVDPQNRPSSEVVFHEYEKVWNKLQRTMYNSF